MSALPPRPLRRIVLPPVGPAAGGLLELSLKPHTPASALSSVDAGSAPSPAPTSTGPTPTGTAGRTGGGCSASGRRTVDGDAIQTRYGPVQVRITLSGGRITAV